MKFDLAEVDTVTLSEDGAVLNLKKLDGTPLANRNGEQITLRMLGPDSKKFRALTRAQVRKRLERKEALPADKEIDEAEEDSIETLVACTVGWVGMLDGDGNPVAATQENVRAVFRLYPVIRDQADLFISNRTNFLLASSGR